MMAPDRYVNQQIKKIKDLTKSFLPDTFPYLPIGHGSGLDELATQ
jgi:hypothetical protein